MTSQGQNETDFLPHPPLVGRALSATHPQKHRPASPRYLFNGLPMRICIHHECRIPSRHKTSRQQSNNPHPQVGDAIRLKYLTLQHTSASPIERKPVCTAWCLPNWQRLFGAVPPPAAQRISPLWARRPGPAACPQGRSHRPGGASPSARDPWPSEAQREIEMYHTTVLHSRAIDWLRCIYILHNMG